MLKIQYSHNVRTSFTHESKSPGLKNVIQESIFILNQNDRRKLFLVLLLNVFLGAIDIIAIGLIGIMGSLSITGVAFQQPGDTVSKVLEWLNLNEYDLRIQFLVLGSLVANFLIIKSLLSLFVSRRILFFLANRSANLSRQLLELFTKERLDFIRSKSPQESIVALTSGVDVVLLSIVGSSVILLSDAVLLSVILFGLFFIDIKIALVSLVFFSGCGILLYKFFNQRARLYGKSFIHSDIICREKISELIILYRELYVRGRLGFYSDAISALRKEISHINAKTSGMPVVSKYSMEIALVVGAIGVASLQFLTESPSRSVATLSVFIVASSRVIPAVLRIQNGLLALKTNAGRATPTLSLIKRYQSNLGVRVEPVVVNQKPPSNEIEVIPSIKCDRIHIEASGDRKDLFKDLSFEVSSGEAVAIVGPNGSGKSTLLDVIGGLVDLSSGTVEIAGLNPNQFVSTWPGAISYLQQNFELVRGTVKENIAAGYNPSEIQDAYIESIINRVGLNEILSWRQGIYTRIGIGQRGLSGGQTQRLAIARALFTNPRVLLLDEPTSSLDAQNQSIIVDEIIRLKGSATILMVTHDLQNLELFDRVIRLS